MNDIKAYIIRCPKCGKKIRTKFCSSTVLCSGKDSCSKCGINVDWKIERGHFSSHIGNCTMIIKPRIARRASIEYM